MPHFVQIGAFGTGVGTLSEAKPNFHSHSYSVDETKAISALKLVFRTSFKAWGIMAVLSGSSI